MADDAANPSDVPDAALRSALEFALKVAAGNVARKLPVPAPLRALLRAAKPKEKLRANQLRVVRSAVESDVAFLTEVAGKATPDHVDAVGLLWLQRPDGWRDAIAAEFGDDAAEPQTATAEGRRRAAAERRADSAEKALEASKKELAKTRHRVDELVRERDGLADDVRRLQALLAEEKAGNRKHRKGSASANERADEAAVELEALRARLAEVEQARDAALEAHIGDREQIDLDHVRSLLAQATRAIGPASTRPAKRTPIPTPGRLHGDPVAAAEHLLRTVGVVALVDGYNVAKQGWPKLELRDQRERLLALCERVAQRTGAKVHVVFDGQRLEGAHVQVRRFVLVTFTEGESADDRLREEVRRLDPHVKVVVVSSDVEVGDSVRRLGANVVANQVLLDLDQGRR